ncbi:MAG: FAD-dependent oxidoreductase, partial [Anaerolineae bacterium]|nr:FAD-dependent oxidoreductase [Anaerolineae bacterium]
MSKIPSAIVIGAGFTGCAVAYDLALRGFDVTVVERGDIANGTSGRTHGLLHSGGRYCVNDQEAAIECIEENVILRKIASQCIEFNGGLFVGLNQSDLDYVDRWIKGAEISRIPIKEIPPKVVLSTEPRLSSEIKVAYEVPDGVFDPLRLALSFAASAKAHGALFFTFHEVIALLVTSGCVKGVRVTDRTSGNDRDLYADITINATGAWAGQIARMANAHIEITPTPGVMVAFDQRLSQKVINRMNEPGDGDIIIPQRKMMVTGTTSFEVDNLDYIPVEEDQVKLMIDRSNELIPSITATKLRGVYMSARPLIGSSVEGRSLTRTFKCYDHTESDGVDGVITITGGKATTCRAMAEKTVNLVCKKMDVKRSCTTKDH